MNASTPGSSGTPSPYAEVKREDLIVRDILAADRTVLANERTLLAYIRTAIALIATGAGVIHLFGLGVADAAGAALIALGVVVLVWGARRFVTVRHRLGAFR